MAKKGVMPRDFQLHKFLRQFYLYNPEKDIQRYPLEDYVTEGETYSDNLEALQRKYPDVIWEDPEATWASLRADEKAEELRTFANYLETEYKEIPKKYRSLIERGEYDEAVVLSKRLERLNRELEEKTKLYKKQRDEARRKAPPPGVTDEEIEADIRRRAARARKPRVPLYRICPIHRTEMERVPKMPIMTERGVTAPPTQREIPELFKIIRTRPGEIPPRISLIPVPDTMEVYYCEEGNRFYERMNAKSKEQSAAFLLRKIERERARVARIAAPPGVRPYLPGTPAARQAERMTIQKHVKWPVFLVQMGLTKADYVALDGLSKRGLVEAFRAFLSERGIYE